MSLKKKQKVKMVKAQTEPISPLDQGNEQVA